MPLPTPEEVKTECGEILHYTSKTKFEEAGGRTGGGTGKFSWTGASDDFIVTAAPAAYQQEDDVQNPMDAIEAYWELFTEGGWTVFVWDRRKNEGWAYQYVGPEWVHFLYECMGRKTPATPAAARVGGDANLLHRVNRYRRSLGASRDLSPGEWTEAELREFLSHAPSTFQNPTSLKQRLMPPR